MKKFCIPFYSAITLIFSAFILTACDDGMTIEVPGPDIEFNFNYSDINNRKACASDADSGYVRIAQSDTIYGKNIESFLAENGQQYASIVEAATIKNACLTISEGNTFSCIDSLKIKYRIVGTDQEFTLAVAGSNDGAAADSLWFNDVKVSKAQVYELLGSNIIATLYARPKATSPDLSCFKPGTSYTFRAKTSLSVKLASATSGTGSSLI
ncbi:MAG: hypothetical protein Q8914_07985 [Bacteroidota bacterium]|nr:hypothetical protein [Bacteroidota bacterium]